jgi:phosphoribosylformylglycinamidine synthase
MLAGGFSAGDELGGSGKFIAAFLRNRAVSDALQRLMHSRDGLMLGICNGFQALVKVGLLPYGEMRPMTADSPTLTANLIGRHVSAYVHTKVVSRLSPWLSECPLGAVYATPVSHGEGRFVGAPGTICALFENDQVATQYVDADGHPTHELPFNPNGSIHAIEGITSPCGRIFGRMGHTERAADDLAINIHGDKHQPIFSSGVSYFQ